MNKCPNGWPYIISRCTVTRDMDRRKGFWMVRVKDILNYLSVSVLVTMVTLLAAVGAASPLSASLHVASSSSRHNALVTVVAITAHVSPPLGQFLLLLSAPFLPPSLSGFILRTMVAVIITVRAIHITLPSFYMTRTTCAYLPTMISAMTGGHLRLPANNYICHDWRPPTN